MDATTATPAQIDGEIARLTTAVAVAEAKREQARETIDRIDAADEFERSYPWNSQEKYLDAVEAERAAIVASAAAQAALAPLNAEFVRRGGWTRFYLVTNTGGHVHHTTGCNTCFPTTQFAWLTDYSGTEHADFVEEAGAKACTVCFPDAPVEVLRRATRIKYEAPEAKARREEREAKKAAAVAAQVVVEGYVEFGSSPRTKIFKTSRAVTNQIADRLTALGWYGEGHPDGAVWINNIESMRKALDDKGVEYDYEKALTTMRKKIKHQGADPKF